MSYDYAKERPRIFTEEGVRMLLAIYDLTRKLIDEAGCCTSGKALVTGDSWVSLACLDYLCEKGILCEIQQSPTPAGQDRIYVAGPKRGGR